MKKMSELRDIEHNLIKNKIGEGISAQAHSIQVIELETKWNYP